jgi:Cdc6-like AAA superfamily ATPase
MSTSAVLPPTPPNENAFPALEKKVSSMATAHAPSSAAIPPPPSEHQHIWIITGPAGCGKTSVAEHLHQTYKMPYLEGDTVSFMSFFGLFLLHTRTYNRYPMRRPMTYGIACWRTWIVRKAEHRAHRSNQSHRYISNTH